MAKFCSNCGAKLNDEQAICLECGVLINNTNKTKLLTNNYKQGIKILHELVNQVL